MVKSTWTAAKGTTLSGVWVAQAASRGDSPASALFHPARVRGLAVALAESPVAATKPTAPGAEVTSCARPGEPPPTRACPMERRCSSRWSAGRGVGAPSVSKESPGLAVAVAAELSSSPRAHRLPLCNNGVVQAPGGSRNAAPNGGSGGAIRFVAPKMIGTIRAYVNGESDVASAGRVRIDTADASQMGTDIRPPYTASLGSFLVTGLSTNLPRLSIVQVAGTTIPAGQTEPGQHPAGQRHQPKSNRHGPGAELWLQSSHQRRPEPGQWRPGCLCG
jgi:hypothetical protein